MTSRIQFCGVIEGSVVVRAGETPEEALKRAERQILDALSRTCRTLGNFAGYGPNVGLELYQPGTLDG